MAGANRGGGGGLAGGNRVNNAQGEGVVDNPETINRGAVDLLRDDQRGRQATAKFLFNQRLRMEEKRRYLAKGNIVTFLFENTVVDRMSHMNRILRVAGFKAGDMKSIKLNEFRGNQAEVLFKQDVEIDLMKIDKKLSDNGLKVEVGRFYDKEEYCMIYGLPLSDNTEELSEKIKDAILPFVKEVKDILPTIHIGKAVDDLFHGLLDGNFRVKVTPLSSGIHIPNFIVVGEACGKVIYSKSLTAKKSMCFNCYSTEHDRYDINCPGPKDWDIYRAEFFQEHQRAHYDKKQLQEDEELGVTTSCESRAEIYLRREELREMEIQNLRLELESVHESSEKQLEDMRSALMEANKELEEYRTKSVAGLQRLEEEKELCCYICLGRISY